MTRTRAPASLLLYLLLSVMSKGLLGAMMDLGGIWGSQLAVDAIDLRRARREKNELGDFDLLYHCIHVMVQITKKMGWK